MSSELNFIQIIFNNVALIIFVLFLAWVHVKPHVIANRICNDQRITAHLIELKNAGVRLQNCIVLRATPIGFIPLLQLDRSIIVTIMKILNKYGYRRPDLALVLFYYAQQDLARFRYMVENGYSYKSFERMSFKYYIRKRGILTVIAIILALIMSLTLANVAR